MANPLKYVKMPKQSLTKTLCTVAIAFNEII